MVMLMLVIPVTAFAENTNIEGYSWTLLASVAGASAFTLAVVQFIKAPLDKVWKIPTRMLAYIISFAVMFGSRMITEGFSFEAILYAGVNALVAGSTAIGAYEVTLKKHDEAKAAAAAAAALEAAAVAAPAESAQEEALG